MVHVSMSCNPAFHTTGAHYINADTTAFMQLIMSDLFKDFPKLRLIIPHGGGAVPFHWGRYRGLALQNKRTPIEEMIKNNVFFDTCVYHLPGIELLTKVVPIDNILFASEMIGAVQIERSEHRPPLRRHQALRRSGVVADRRRQEEDLRRQHHARLSGRGRSASRRCAREEVDARLRERPAFREAGGLPTFPRARFPIQISKSARPAADRPRCGRCGSGFGARAFARARMMTRRRGGDHLGRRARRARPQRRARIGRPQAPHLVGEVRPSVREAAGTRCRNTSQPVGNGLQLCAQSRQVLVNGGVDRERRRRREQQRVPSGGAFATDAAPITVPPPVRFSITTALPRRLSSGACSRRAS